MNALRILLNNSPVKVAESLIGCEIYTKLGDSLVGGVICETEAYLAEGDAAAHNKRGRTASTNSLFESAGTLYVHQMRQHVLLDVVTQEDGIPGSVLIRALEPRSGISVMQERRGITDLEKLCRGPGNLCKSLGIDKSFDGFSVLDREPRVILNLNSKSLFSSIENTSRIGINSNVDAPLRFSVPGSRYVSGKR